jgi:hypothetical protein
LAAVAAHPEIAACFHLEAGLLRLGRLSSPLLLAEQESAALETALSQLVHGQSEISGAAG